MIIFFFFIIFTFLSSESSDFCNVDNILLVEKKIKNCKKNQLLFGNLTFNSKRANLKFQYNDQFKVKIPLKFKKEIELFIKNNCLNDNLKVKTITNLIKNTNIYEYNNKIIISCIFK